MKNRMIIAMVAITGILSLTGCSSKTEPLATETSEYLEISETPEEASEFSEALTEEPSTEAAIVSITDTTEMEAVLGSLTEEDTSICIYGSGANESEGIFTVFTHDDVEYGAVVINDAFGNSDMDEIKVAGTVTKEDVTDPYSRLTTKTYIISDIYTGEDITVTHPDDITGSLEVSGNNIHYTIGYRDIDNKVIMDFLHNLINGQRNLKSLDNTPVIMEAPTE